MRFAPGAPGTYLYGAMPGVLDAQARPTHPTLEREQMAGGLVVDSAGARTDDRVVVINIWGEPTDSLNYRNALTLNGQSWPYTERMDATVGDTLRWRVINGSRRNHPMHLHGFYFRVDARGTALRDTLYAPGARRLAVTEDLSPGNTMAIAWAPDRPGNWLFHCHVGFHVLPATRLDPPPGNEHDLHSGEAMRHMAGLVLGSEVAPGAGWTEPVRGTARSLHLFVDEGPRRGHAPRALSFVLQRTATPPAPDSVEIPGSVLVLTRGESTDITVVNRLREGTSIHWHGIELESYFDGVAGWSGAGARMAPVVAPADSFVARLTLPRAGTFIYHTHLNDIEQLTSGLYGAIVVLEPGQRFDSTTDHVFVSGWDGDEEPARLLVNGDSLPPPMTMAVGVPHRLRFVNIGPAARVLFSLRRDTTLVRWRALAKDGADLPAGAATPRRAVERLAVGETFDAEFLPVTPGDYVLTVGLAAPGAPPTYVRRIRVQ